MKRQPHLPQKTIKKLYAFSLLELIISTALFALLALMTAPNLSSIMNKVEINRVGAALKQSLNLARSTAINNGHLVYLCPLRKNDITHCNQNLNFNQNWSHGWVIYSDVNKNHQLDRADNIIKTVKLTSSTFIIFNQKGRLRYFSNGSARSSGFYLCSNKHSLGQHLYLLHTGRARIKKQLSQTNKNKCRKYGNK